MTPYFLHIGKAHTLPLCNAGAMCVVFKLTALEPEAGQVLSKFPIPRCYIGNQTRGAVSLE